MVKIAKKSNRFSENEFLQLNEIKVYTYPPAADVQDFNANLRLNNLYVEVWKTVENKMG